MYFVLIFISVYYVIVYFSIDATPGNSPNDHPLGWWGWFDQGKYLLSSSALSKFDLTPDKHFYPPLYPALGAFFLKWSSGHMYFFIDLLCLLWFAFVFVRVADRYIPRWGSIVVLFGTTIFNYSLFENYVIPWTSTLSAALLSSGFLGLVWLNEASDGTRAKVSGRQVFFVALCLGLLVPTRPADAVVGSVIGLGLMFEYLQARRKYAARVPRIFEFFAISISGYVIGPLLFLSFNAVVFGTPAGGYIQFAGTNGFFPADLLEKFFSLWLDGFTLYGEPNAGLTERYPWLFLSLTGLLWVMFKGDNLLKSVAYAIVLLFVIYLPYGDLLPNGLWRFLNIHYFKWTFPFLGLFAILLIKQLLASWSQGKARIVPLVFVSGIPLLLLSLNIVVDVTPVSKLAASDKTGVSFDFENKQVDLVDFKGLSGDFTDVYFGSHRLVLDGRELIQVRDYRLLPMSWGVRLIFIRPVIGRSIEFYPDPKLTRLLSNFSAQIGTYRFTLSPLKPFRQLARDESISFYELGKIIDFSKQGNSSLYVAQGWSVPEVWGRWSINREAKILMRLTEPTNQALQLELVMGAFVGYSQPCQQLSILVNSKEVTRQSLCIGKDGAQQSFYKVVIAGELMRADGKLDIHFVTPTSISPKTLGVSSDDRVLGVAVRSLRLVPSQR